MAQVQPLSRPPITEALIDIRTSLVPSFRPEAFLAVHDQLKPHLPNAEEIRHFETTFDVVEGKPTPSRHKESGVRGILFRSEDGKSVAQFRVDGFTYNRLAPYTSWDRVRAEALKLWQVYIEVAMPHRIDRVALRYINRLQLPPTGVLNDYLAILPPLLPGVPSHVSDFLLRISSFDPATGNRANVTQALQPDTAGVVSTLIIDIDAFNAIPRGISAPELGPVLDVLRIMKNEIFFGMITDQTVERYR